MAHPRLWKAAPARLLVLGDVMLDRYVWGDVRRVSPEAPVPVLTADQREDRPGGAANVAQVLCGLEVGAVLAGVIGDDGDGQALRSLLNGTGIDAAGVVADDRRPTTRKERYVGRAAGQHPQQVLRVDREMVAPLGPEVAESLCRRVTELLPACQGVLIADYGKGVCTPGVVQRVMAAARHLGLPVLVDPPRGRDWTVYRGATVLKPNRREAEMAWGRPVADPAVGMTAGMELCTALDLAAVVVTLDREGLVLATRAGQTRHCPTQARTVYDITGAGDTVLAVLGIGVSAGVPWDELLPLANRAAGRAVAQFGNARLSRADLAAEGMAARQTKLCTLAELERHVAAHRQQGRRVVFTNGCFDLLHAGHVACLEECAAAGDVLIVAVNDDAGVRRLKGAGRPVCSQEDRVRMLAALACVAHVILFAEDTPHRLLTALRPDVLAKGGTYRPEEVVGREVVAAYGGTILLTKQVPGLSTTELLARLRTEERP